MASPKPIIVLVHGAWHSPEHYAKLTENLQSHGYKTNSVWLPTMHYSRMNPPLEPAKVGLQDDIRAVRSAILDELSTNAEADVAVLSHSSGGTPASAAVENLDKVTRAKLGFKNGVSSLLVMTGLLIPSGISSLECGGGQVPPTASLSTMPDPQDSNKEIQISRPVPDPGPIALFYHDLPNQDEAKRYAELCTHQIWAMSTTVIPFAGWKVPGLKVFYLVCEEDRVLPPGFQRIMIENANQERATAANEALDGSAKNGVEGSSAGHGGDPLEKYQKDSLAGIESSKAILENVRTGTAVATAGDDGEAATGAEQDHERGAITSKIHVTSIKSGHNPFLSHLEETAQWVRRDILWRRVVIAWVNEICGLQPRSRHLNLSDASETVVTTSSP